MIYLIRSKIHVRFERSVYCINRYTSKVFASIGHRKSGINSRLGFEEKPSAGMLSHPVKKTRISSEETLFSTEKYQKRVKQLLNDDGRLIKYTTGVMQEKT